MHEHQEARLNAERSDAFDDVLACNVTHARPAVPPLAASRTNARGTPTHVDPRSRKRKEFYPFVTVARSFTSPRSALTSIVSPFSTFNFSPFASAPLTRHPSGRRSRSSVFVGPFAGSFRSAVTSPALTFDVTTADTSPNIVGALSTLIVLPSSSHRRGVPNISRKVSGLASSFRS